MSNDQILSRLKQARTEVLEEQVNKGNRALAIVLTHIDTALLWVKEDTRLKGMVRNEPDPKYKAGVKAT